VTSDSEFAVAIATARMYLAKKPFDLDCGYIAASLARAFFIFSAICAASLFAGLNSSFEPLNKEAPPTIPINS
jgi:hypothetical protein